MDHQQAKDYLINQPHTVEDFPFGADVSVFKVKGKMFATLSFGQDKQHYWMNLKCDPDEAVMLRDIHSAVIPGYHMNKLHWNTVILDGSLPEGEIKRMVDNSFKLVVSKLSKKEQQSILYQLA